MVVVSDVVAFEGKLQLGEDVHADQLLDQQFGGVGQLDLHHLALSGGKTTFLHLRQKNSPLRGLASAISPHRLHTCTRNRSDTVNSR